jgi:hypothetical protein
MSLSSAISDNSQTRHTGYGLPCANCRAYYAADLTACPICSSHERVPANYGDTVRLRRMTISQMTTPNRRPQ